MNASNNSSITTGNKKSTAKGHRKRHIPAGPAGILFQSQNQQQQTISDGKSSSSIPVPERSKRNNNRDELIDNNDDDENNNIPSTQATKQQRQHHHATQQNHEEAYSPVWIAVQCSLGFATPNCSPWLTSNERYNIIRPFVPTQYVMISDIIQMNHVWKIPANQYVLVMVHSIQALMTEHFLWTVGLIDETGCCMQAWVQPSFAQKEQQRSGIPQFLRLGVVWMLSNVTIQCINVSSNGRNNTLGIDSFNDIDDDDCDIDNNCDENDFIVNERLERTMLLTESNIQQMWTQSSYNDMPHDIFNSWLEKRNEATIKSSTMTTTTTTPATDTQHQYVNDIIHNNSNPDSLRRIAVSTIHDECTVICDNYSSTQSSSVSRVSSASTEVEVEENYNSSDYSKLDNPIIARQNQFGIITEPTYDKPSSVLGEVQNQKVSSNNPNHIITRINTTNKNLSWSDTDFALNVNPSLQPLINNSQTNFTVQGTSDSPTRKQIDDGINDDNYETEQGNQRVKCTAEAENDFQKLQLTAVFDDTPKDYIDSYNADSLSSTLNPISKSLSYLNDICMTISEEFSNAGITQQPVPAVDSVINDHQVMTTEKQYKKEKKINSSLSSQHESKLWTGLNAITMSLIDIDDDDMDYNNDYDAIYNHSIIKKNHINNNNNNTFSSPRTTTTDTVIENVPPLTKMNEKINLQKKTQSLLYDPLAYGNIIIDDFLNDD